MRLQNTFWVLEEDLKDDDDDDDEESKAKAGASPAAKADGDGSQQRPGPAGAPPPAPSSSPVRRLQGEGGGDAGDGGDAAAAPKPPALDWALLEELFAQVCGPAAAACASSWECAGRLHVGDIQLPWGARGACGAFSHLAM